MKPLTASIQFIPVWNQLEYRTPLLDHVSVHPHNHTLPHSHTVLNTCTCCYDLTKGTQDKDFSYSFSILSLCACLCSWPLSPPLSHSFSYCSYSSYDRRVAVHLSASLRFCVSAHSLRRQHQIDQQEYDRLTNRPKTAFPIAALQATKADARELAYAAFIYIEKRFKSLGNSKSEIRKVH